MRNVDDFEDWILVQLLYFGDTRYFTITSMADNSKQIKPDY